MLAITSKSRMLATRSDSKTHQFMIENHQNHKIFHIDVITSSFLKLSKLHTHMLASKGVRELPLSAAIGTLDHSYDSYDSYPQLIPTVVAQCTLYSGNTKNKKKKQSLSCSLIELTCVRRLSLSRHPRLDFRKNYRRRNCHNSDQGSGPCREPS